MGGEGDGPRSRRMGEQGLPQASDRAKVDFSKILDEELIERCLAGQKEPWDEMYRRFNRLIMHRAQQRGVKAYDFEDVGQDTLIAIVEILRKRDFDPNRAKLATLIWEISDNICIDYWRRFNRIPTEDGGGVVEDIPAETASRPDEHLERLEALEIVRDALRSLEAVCRELLWLRYRDGLSYREIAGILEGKVGAVRERALRCRKSLKQILEARGITP